MIKAHLVLALFLFTLVSCGENFLSDKKETVDGPKPATLSILGPMVTSENGQYEITFKDINPKYESLESKGRIKLADNELDVTITTTKAPKLRSIYQTLYVGQCPDVSDDKNGDGIIDINEVNGKLTEAVMPLDSDINSSSETKTVYPQTNPSGKYQYTAKGTLEAILNDLSSKGFNGDIDLEGSVVILQGLPTHYKFPNSVESAKGLPASETLPMACGTIKRLRS